MLRFDGRVALVTGAGRGLGREHALLLAERGARVLVNDHAPTGTASAQAVADEINALGGEAAASSETVATPEGGSAIVADALARFGRLDVLINNAGIIRDHAFHNMTTDEVTDVLDVHLGGAFWVTAPAWRHMRERGYGRLVFTTSLSGLIGNFGQANYAAAKMGVVGLTRVLAAEGRKYGITSNAVAPLAHTQMAESLSAFDVRELSPRDVAATAAYLAHESCAVSGEILSSVGGRVARYFIGLTPGVYQPGGLPEDVAAHIEEICDTAGFIEPRAMSDEIDQVLALIDGSDNPAA